ncbi:MAG TPA: CoA-binding protein [Anaeromyxobacter sp.]|nr:CoA-binding protein [Anaeromyxobacter sp.]
MAAWEENLISDDEGIRKLLASTRRVAVLGIKTEEQAQQPAYSVPAFLAHAGLEIVPVPVYFPDAKQILGKPVYRKVADVPGDVDIVDVFRRPADVPAHLPDIIAKRPRAVWLQLGIRNDEAAQQLAREGILVVQDRCLKVEWSRLGPHP